MLEYMTILLVISLVLTLILSLLKKHIPLSPRVIYGTVGISFALGAFFPMAVTNMTPFGVTSVYFGLIFIIAIALGYIESIVYLNSSGTSFEAAGFESENLGGELLEDSFSNLLAEETGALEACAAQDQPLNEVNPEVDTEAILPLQAAVNMQVEERPAVDLSAGFQHTEDIDSIDAIDEDIQSPEKELLSVPDFSADETQHITEQVSPLEIADTAEVIGTCHGEDQLAHDQENNKSSEDITDIITGPVTIDEVNPEVDTEAILPLQAAVNMQVEDKPAVDLSAGFQHTEDIDSIDAIDEDIQPPEEELLSVPDLSADDTQQVITEQVSPLEIADTAEVIDTYRGEDQLTHDQENNKFDEDITEIITGPVTINDYISAGFKSRTAGDLVGAVKYFFAAFQMNREQHISTTLAYEISAVYQELGQYFQAGMIVKSVLEQENLINEPHLRQKLNGHLLYLETLVDILKITKMPNAPYSKIPGIIKIKANLETDKKLKELIQGGGTH